MDQFRCNTTPTTDRKVRILISGPMGRTGGVSVHTESIIEALKTNNSVEILEYNSYSRYKNNRCLDLLFTEYNRTIGIMLYLVKYRNRYDLIHSNASGGMNGFIEAFFSSVIARITNKPMFLTFHHGRVEEFISRNRIIFSLVCENVDRLFLVSKNQEFWINKFYSNNFEDKIQITSNGYDDKIFNKQDKTVCRKELGIRNDSIVLLNIANLLPVKNQMGLVEAIKAVTEINENVHLYIIGKGPLHKDLSNAIAELGLVDKVILVGEVNHDEIPRWINASDAVVMSSHYEGVPTVLFETLACGRPFISSSVGGIPEIITDDEIGLLFKPGDKSSMVDALVFSISKKWDQEHISDYASRYSWSHVADQYVAEYLELLSKC